jgi:hypothetical protein
MEVQNLEVQNIVQKPVFMFKGHEISTGKKMSPLKVIVYGDNGIGKTTFAASSKNPIIIDLEGNCNHIDAPKQRVSSLNDFEELLNALIAQEHDYKTLVIDSLDSLEILISEKITNNHTTQELSYGKSSAIWARYIKEIITKLEKLSNLKGMNIVFTAHWKVKTANNPMTEQYDRYDLRISEAMRTGFCNWVQCILLALKEVLLEEKNATGFGKKKAKNIERRVLYTRGDPTYYGKNVFDLPEKIQLDWEQFTNSVKNFYSK